MIPGFEEIVEQRIRQAQRDGSFDNLEGTNKPLKFEDQNIPEEYRMAHKILKNAGFLPPEVELRKKVTQTEEMIRTADAGSPEHSKLQKKLNYLLTKLGTMRGDRPLSPILADTYRNNMLNKIK